VWRAGASPQFCAAVPARHTAVATLARTLGSTNNSMRTHLFILAIVGGLFATTPAPAEIEKLATICGKGICPHWWPKLAPPAGWSHDREHSYLYNLNAMAPQGQSFADAETVMYANAIYKPRVPDAATLTAFIEGDHTTFTEKSPGIVIKADEAQRTKDGTLAKTWRLEPKGNDQWERIAYFEEDDYYMVFVISSRTAAGLARSMPSFESLLANYAK
jgi:hypothetical protein